MYEYEGGVFVDDVESPLLLAVRSGDLTRVRRLLLEAEVNVNAKSGTQFGGMTALHQAVVENNSRMVRFLLLGGAATSIRTRNNANQTPLDLAQEPEKDPDILSLLRIADRSYRPRPRIREAERGLVSCRNFAFIEAVMDDDRTRVREMLALTEPMVNVNARTELGFTALHSAVSWQSAGMVRLLLLEGGARPSVNTKDRFGFSPFHQSVITQNHDIMMLLVFAGAVVDSTAMDIAISNADARAIKILLIAGGSVQRKNALSGKTALHIAARLNDPELLNVLIRREVDVNCIDNKRLTPLHEAAIHTRGNSHYWIVEFLMQNGAQARLEDSYKQNADAYLKRNPGTENLQKLLLSRWFNIKL